MGSSAPPAPLQPYPGSHGAPLFPHGLCLLEGKDGEGGRKRLHGEVEIVREGGRRHLHGEVEIVACLGCSQQLVHQLWGCIVVINPSLPCYEAHPGVH